MRETQRTMVLGLRNSLAHTRQLAQGASQIKTKIEWEGVANGR